MEPLPSIPQRPGKSEQYLFGHIVLPKLLFERADVLSTLTSEDPAQAVQDLWDGYAQQWGKVPRTYELRARWYRHDTGGLAIAIDLPEPADVPEPHGVLMVFQPVRAFFVIERTSQQNLEKYLRTAWVRLSSDGQQTPIPSHAGFLCEWTADGAHRNYRYVAVNVGSMLTKVSSLVGVDGKWEEVAPSTIAPDELGAASVRVPERCMDPTERQKLEARVREILKGAVDVRSKRAAVEHLLATLHDAQLHHGNDLTEITLHRQHVIALMIELGDLDRADLYNEDWRYFCHEYRGSRAPETAISYTSWARIIAADPRTSSEYKDKRLRLIHAMRDRLPGGIRPDLPGADDPEVTATVRVHTEDA